MKALIRAGDEVEIIVGDQKGVRGKVLRVVDGGGRLVVDGVRLYKKCFKKSSKHPEGATVQIEFPIQRSNVRKIFLEK